MKPAIVCERCESAAGELHYAEELGQTVCEGCFAEHADQVEPQTERKKSTQAARLVELANDVEFFHDPHGAAFATFTVGDHRETAALRTRGFRSYIERRFYEDEGKPPSAQAMQDALGVMEGEARFGGAELPVHVRLAGDDERIVLDLGNDRWAAVAVTAGGWEVDSDPRVKFRRPKGMGALPDPERGGDLAELRALVNVADRDWPLQLSWMIGALRPAGPFPVLAGYGEQGTAKSTTQRITRAAIDPSSAALRAAPRNEHELMIAARNGWIVAFDNASTIQPWLSDAFARLSTGAGFAARQLYSDDEEMIFEEQRPILVNGIEEVVSRPDLLDRALILEHPRIAAAQRTPERLIWTRFAAAHPRILGALLDVVAAALRNLPAVELAELPRMADFCEWLVAAAPALGWEPGRFLDTYAANRESAHEVAIDSSPIASLIPTIAETGFEGSAAELLSIFNEAAEEATTRLRAWPKSPSALSGALRRLAPNLREIGIQVTFERSGGSRQITIRTGRKTPSSPSSPSSRHGFGDGSDGRDGDSRTQSLEAAVLAGSDKAERIRSSVNGAWGDPNQPPAAGTVWDYSGQAAPLGLAERR